MDIGTGKDLSEYDGVPYHLIDICEPGTKYNLFQYLQDFAHAYKQVTERGAVPILCGGTGLYLEAVLKDYQLSPVPQNPELRKQLEGKSLAELTEMLRQLKERNSLASGEDSLTGERVKYFYSGRPVREAEELRRLAVCMKRLDDMIKL